MSQNLNNLFVTLAILTALALLREPARSQSREVTLNAVGDILFARGIERKIAAKGKAYPFRSITPLLRGADVVIGNLETTLSNRPFAAGHEYRFRAVPGHVKLLREAGFTCVNLANNHALDCGAGGLRDTLQALSAEGIRSCGAKTKEAGADVAEREGVRIAFVGFSDFPPTLPGSAPLSIHYASEEAIDREVRGARRRADVVVASFHWGQEQSPVPTARQKLLARAAAAAGADLVLGHHPHVLQGFEILHNASRRTLVVYSLGNFLFDGHKEAEKQSLILRCRFDRTGLRSAEIVPVRIDHSAPRAAAGSERSAILSQLTALSLQLGTRVDGARVNLPP